MSATYETHAGEGLRGGVRLALRPEFGAGQAVALAAILRCMTTRWRYGSLTVLSVLGRADGKIAGLTAIILEDAAGRELLSVLPERRTPSQSTWYAAQDLAGERGWIIAVQPDQYPLFGPQNEEELRRAYEDVVADIETGVSDLVPKRRVNYPTRRPVD